MKRILAPLAVLLMLAPIASADVFVLSGGGQVKGELLNREQSPRKQYVIQTVEGVKVTLDASQVKRVVRSRPGEAEYDRIAPTYPDTAAAQWELAEWCRKNKLTTQRQVHLRRVIELDPHHAQARSALGYKQVSGEWVTYDERMIKSGHVKVNGKWLLPQEVELADKKKKLEGAQLDWCQKLKLWRTWLGTDRDEQAREKIAAINDRNAIRGLAIGLRDDRDPRVRVLFAQALGRFEVPEATHELAAAAIYDPVEEVRLTCLDYLERKRRPDVIAYFVAKLRDKKSTNEIINLAGAALGRMKDPAAIGPLIDALVTVHKFKVVTGGGGNMSSSFGKGPNSGGTGISMNAQPKIIKRNIPNQAVLDALVAITGQNFNFDKDAWQTWYASQRKKPDVLDGRRDKE
jgi:hypothetical protein